ncbi:MAG: protein phosphatase 2C domain-containing protein [Thermodesulfobacteriota bacterium]
MPQPCDAAFHTATGPRRNNQDAARVDARLGYALVADGMGGAAGGEVASREAVETAGELLARGLGEAGSPEAEEALLVRLFEEANRRIYARAQTTSDLLGMGTTMVLVLVRGGRFWSVNVGDSRAYLLRGRTLAQLSRDHSLVQARVEAGLITPEEAPLQPDRNVLTQAVGTMPEVEPEVVRGQARPGDVFVLTSDGVHGVLSPGQILKAAAGPDPEAAAVGLVEAALAAGTRDNATAAVLQVTGEPAAPAPFAAESGRPADSPARTEPAEGETSLESILRGPIIPPATPARRGTWWWLAGLAALAGAVGAVLWAAFQFGP